MTGAGQAIAQDGRADRPAITAAVTLGAPGRLTFIGPSGQLFQPGNGPAVWQRKSIGGVAADVVGAVTNPAGTVFVAGRRTPLYRLAGDGWHVHPLPNRGRVVLPHPTSAPVLAIGRHVYTWRTDAWRRLTSARTRIAAIWSSSTGRVYAATEAGRIARYDRGAWTNIPSPLGPRDRVAWLVGRSGKKLYAVTRAGTVVEVLGRAGRALAAVPSLQGLRPDAATVDERGVLWLVARTTTHPGSGDATAEADDTNTDETSDSEASNPGAAVLVRAERGTLTVADNMSVFDRTRVTVLDTTAGKFLVLATQNGLVRLRSADGTWQNGKVIVRLNTELRGSEAAAPARTR